MRSLKHTIPVDESPVFDRGSLASSSSLGDAISAAAGVRVDLSQDHSMVDRLMAGRAAEVGCPVLDHYRRASSTWFQSCSLTFWHVRGVLLPLWAS